MKFLNEIPFNSKVTDPGRIYLPRKLREILNLEFGQEVTILLSKDKNSVLVDFKEVD